MEFVGKSVIKDSQGFGAFQGLVQSYDSSTGFCTIAYEDGNFEEIDCAEVSRLIASPEQIAGLIVGRKAKHRCHDPGKIDSNLNGSLVIEPELGLNLENNADVNANVIGNASVSVGVIDCVAGNGNLGGGLDLNRGIEVDEVVENVEKGREVGGIDLNVSVEDVEFDGNGVSPVKVGSLGEEGKKERGFDLNLGFDDEGVNEMNRSVDVEVCVGLGEELRNGDVGGVNSNDVEIRVSDGQLEEGCSEGVTPTLCENGNSGRRKRRKVEKVLSSPAKTVLRRSARRAKVAAFAEAEGNSTMVEDEANDMSVSGITEELEEKPVVKKLKMVVEPVDVTPVKIELPPSSANLDLEGIPVVDLFSVYSCLRSFSTLLYLSPFELEEFVAALKSRTSNLLIDFIHVSILQTLRKHLELLANEGCESASSCLRNLNWDLLDEITWPVFMVEYLLIHGSCLKPGFSLNQCKFFDDGYYMQPVNVKIELLRCLCDDTIEVEAFRSELTRRRITVGADTVADWTLSNDTGRKRKISSDDFLLSEDVEVADGNSDECRLCKMDGNLMCCDGCPAAYHSKCIGIVSSLLPEGDWYCPECAISRHSFGSKPQKSSRGAELLGIDPFGRLFFNCVDYLLVSESNDTDSSFSYYHKADLSTVIQLLESSNSTYDSIRSAIVENWAMPTVSGQLDGDMSSDNCIVKGEVSIGRKTKRSKVGRPIRLGIEGSVPSDVCDFETVKPGTVNQNSLADSKESEEVVLQANEVLPNSHRPLSNLKRISAAKSKNKHLVSMQSLTSNVKETEEDGVQDLSGYNYINTYNFGRTSASVVEELLRKPSDKGSANVPKTQEEIISIQLKFITKKSTKFCWATIQQLNGERRKEKCGWCYCCRFSVEDRDCLFNINRSSIPESLKADIDYILSERNNKGHLVDIISHILCMEERLRGLLLGPWLSPPYSELWRKCVLQATGVSSLKHQLLMLESNLHPLALSADWSKHVDSVTTMGSASYFVANSRVNSKNGISKKKGRYADCETKSSAADSGLKLFWWRGGKTSRALFNWKVIPHSFALKAARKAGAMKMPDILYSDSLENIKRSKHVAWKAAVEASRSIEQVALQVRELDLNIRWDEIENTQPHFLLDKETIKSVRLFKKAIIRRKSVEGTLVKYLLDFGKRRNIPEVVIKHGLKLEDSDSERKKYWLDESYVPLYLIKIFEERRVIRKAGKTKPNVARKGCKKNNKKKKKLSEEKGFEYLFAKAAMAEDYRCEHCNKNVPVSEAVSCELCTGLFHKRHVMISSGGFTCRRCRAGKQVKNNISRGKKKIGKILHAKRLKVGRRAMSKVKLQKDGKTVHHYQRMSLRTVNNTNVSSGVALRRSARTAKVLTPQPAVVVGARKRKRNKSINVALKKTRQTPSLKKRRTRVFHPFWTNGLRLSRKPKDERVANFKRKRLCVAFESSDGVSDQPKCSLCLEQEFKPTLVYIACDTCEVWFHGEAVGVSRRNIKSLIGFKCHRCREENAPICPFAGSLRDNVATSIEESINDAQVLPEIAN